jgi:hypothetical protein
MTVTTIDLYDILKSKIGESEAKTLVEFVEQKVQSKLIEEINSFATKEDIHLLELKIEKVRSDLIKWMFVFWVGQMSFTLAMIMLLQK